MKGHDGRIRRQLGRGDELLRLASPRTTPGRPCDATFRALGRVARLVRPSQLVAALDFWQSYIGRSSSRVIRRSDTGAVRLVPTDSS